MANAGQVNGLAQVRHQGRQVRTCGAGRGCGASSGLGVLAGGPGGGCGRASRRRVLPDAEVAVPGRFRPGSGAGLALFPVRRLAGTWFRPGLLFRP